MILVDKPKQAEHTTLHYRRVNETSRGELGLRVASCKALDEQVVVVA